MILYVTEHDRIATDDYQWKVQKYRGTYKSGKHIGLPKWETWAYCGTLPHTVEVLTHRLIREMDTTTVSEAIDGVSRVSAAVREALEGLRMPDIRVDLGGGDLTILTPAPDATDANKT